MIPAVGVPDIPDFGAMIRSVAVQFAGVYVGEHRIVAEIALREGDSPLGVVQAIARNVTSMARAWMPGNKEQ